ncbi:unnamed protein product, partial [Didymodactylos carnosus]
DAEIKFETRSITSLPENIRSKPIIKCNIISINELDKETLLLDGVQNMKRRDVLYAIKHQKPTEQLEHERYLNDIHCCFCEKEDLFAGLHEFKIHLNAG